MRHIRIRLLPFLVLGSFVLTGMSRPLLYKRIQGQGKHALSGLALVGPPVAYLKENVNNQGCIGKKTLDLLIVFSLKNNSKGPIRIEEKQVIFSIDGQKYQSQTSRYVIKGKTYTTPYKTFTLPPGKQVKLRFGSNAFLPDTRLKRINRIKAQVVAGKQSLDLVFTGVQKVPTQSGFQSHRHKI